MEKNLKNIRQEFKQKGIFYTTPELAETLKGYVDFEPRRIYDPTCGQGNLLSVFPDKVEKYGQEIYQDELDKAKERLSNFHGYCGDTLKDDGFRGELFDMIVANPPFSIKYEPETFDISEQFPGLPCLPPPSKADYAFILHILSHLSDNGKAVCLEFPGILYRGQREGKIRRWLVEQNWVERVVHIPGNTFIDTSTATCVIVFNKHKDNTDIIFEDKEYGLEKNVSLAEVKDNDYVLSVSTYIQHEEQKEEIDIDVLNANITEMAIDSLKNEIEKRKILCNIDGGPDPTNVIVARVLRVMADVLDKCEKEIDIAG